jgi:hypothetical protein
MTDLDVAAKLRAAFEVSPTILAVTSLDDGRLEAKDLVAVVSRLLRG